MLFSDPFSKKHRVRWEDDAYKLNGIPFTVHGTRVLDCQHGKDRKEKVKKKLKEEKQNKIVGRKDYMNTNTRALDKSPTIFHLYQ